MAVPTIASVSPVSGLTGGSFLVDIRGTGFQLPPTPPPTGKTTAPGPSVEVLFGTVPGTRALVVSSARLLVTAPIHDPETVDITVRNIDQAGAVVSGETVTALSAFTFARPDITLPTELQRLVRALLIELARQVLAEVNLVVHTDYDDDDSDGLDVTQIAQLPAIVITGPKLRENRFFSLNQAREVPAASPGEYVLLGVPYTVDLVFGIIGITGGDNGPTQQLFNLQAATMRFFQRNSYLRMLRDPNGDPNDFVQYEMDVTPEGDMEAATVPGNSNVRHFKGEIVIRGLDIDDPNMSAIPTAATADQAAPGGVNDPSAVVLDGGAIEQTGS